MRRAVLPPGTRVGRYEVRELLGRGGMGEVHRAHDPELLRDVALKILHEGSEFGSDAAKTAEVTRRFLREARAAARLNHPHAVTIFDVGTTADGTPYIAMELVTGETLREVLVSKRRVPLETRVAWLRQIAEVLAAAHAAGIIHRDVKPENVIIRAADRVAKVLDFGIARAPSIDFDQAGDTMTAGDPLASFTAKGAMVGTLSYMPPEQIRGEALDGRADQFAWGVVAFEVLVGELPWSEKQSFRLAMQIMTTDAPPPRATGSAIPKSLDAIVQRALSRDAADRYPDMRALLVELDEVEAELAAADDGPPPSTAPAGGVTVPQPELLPQERTPPEPTPPEPTPVEPTPPEPTPVERTALDRTPVERTALDRTPPSSLAQGVDPHRRRRALALGAVALIAIVSAVGLLQTRPTDVTVVDASGKQASADDARSHCTQRSADDLYARALETFRTDSEQLAAREMERVLADEPTCAAPHLWLALFYYPVDPLQGRTHFVAARDSHGALSARDRALVAASTAYFDDPPDAVTWAKRVREAARTRPRDGDLAYWEAYALWRAADGAGALEAAARATKLAPDSVRARWLGAIVRADLLADVDGAIRDLERCITELPAASSCQGERALLLAQQGRCAELDQVSRAWLARAPGGASPRLLLATALLSQGAARGGVEEAWTHGSDRILEGSREDTRARGLARIALHYGDFATAETQFRARIAAATAREDASGRLAPAAELAAIYTELGRTPDAKRLADENMDREPALARDDSVWSLTPQDNAMAPALLLAWAAGRDVASKREAWLARALAWERAGRVPKGFAWITGWARFVRTPEDAKAALSAAAELPKPDVDRWLPTQLTAWLAGAHALGGREREALPLLRRATSACDGWTWPAGDHIRALYLRGVAAAELGERAEAREALESVATRWPTTTTGRAARTRLEHLK